MAIIIACLGLFGLAAFKAEQRTKEIAVRKVLGAALPNIIKIITVEFVLMVILANLIAWPAAFYILNGWLEIFAHRIELGPVPFILASAAALTAAFITVAVQAYRISTVNPSVLLKDE